MEDLTDADYMHAKKVCKDSEVKKITVNITIYIFKAIHFFLLMFPKSSEKCV